MARTAKHAPIENPTLRDLFVQGLGVNRCMCPNPQVMDTRGWDGKAETELNRLPHTRRTEGRLRELVAADAAAAAGSFRRYAADGRLAKMAEVAGPGPFDDGPLPTAEEFDAMPDWDLKDEWVSLRMRTAFYEMYDRSLEMKAAETLAEMTQGSPAP